MQNTQIRYVLKSNYSDSRSYYQADTKMDCIVLDSDSKIDTEIDYNQFITEDDEPVDNLFSERQQRLLPESLYASWERDKPFLALSNVGIYETNPTTPIVPDVLLSLDVKPAENIWEKKHRCYFMSIFGKPPELVIEIVSNKVGKERKHKRLRYQNMGVKYYIIYDPGLHIYKTSLHAYQLKNHKYVSLPSNHIRNKRLWFDDLKIGITIQQGNYEDLSAEWLRWYDSNGKILQTGTEKAEIEKKRAEKTELKLKAEKKRAEKTELKLKAEKKRAEKTELKLKAEKKRAEIEKNRAIAAEKELALLKAKLALLT